MAQGAFGEIFFYSQAIVIALIVFGILRSLFRSSSSGFGFRESDRKYKSKTQAKGPEAQLSDQRNMAEDKVKIRKPLQLSGIRIDVPPHLLLGVSLQADEKTIESAYKRLMKQYHPDKVASAGSPQWQEAQKIAQAIIQARQEMLSRFKKK